jgi:cellobiose epimerase
MERSLRLAPFWAGTALLLACCTISCNDEKRGVPGYDTALKHEVSLALDTLAGAWYPRVIDNENGGYWSDFDYAWEREGPQNKMIVSQARHIWSASVLASYYGDTSYLPLARHGFNFIKHHMWDNRFGGFHTQMGRTGDSLRLMTKTKSAYGNAFAIYGLAAYHKVSGDTAALDLARRTFHWLEQHAHDSVYGGYFDILKEDGSWLLDVKEDTAQYENFIRKDWKDQNSSIHLMEAFTALYEVWPDSLLRERLEEMLVLIRDTITTDKGYLILHLERDWSPVSFRDSTEAYRTENFYLDHVSFGHDVETAFLMLETSHVLGMENDTLTLRKAKRMVDHALEHGWDDRLGGFFDGGYYNRGSEICAIRNAAKVWWAQAEGLNALLLMARLFPNEERYYNYFIQQWNYINRYMIDHKNGGWYHEGLDSNPMAATHAKANIWKTSYHNARALINVVQMLEGTYILTKGEQGM